MAPAARRTGAGTTDGCAGYGICRAPITAFISTWRCADCRQCGAVKRERQDFLVENALHTKRFALYLGRRYRSGTIRDVAAELRLD